MQKRIAKTVAEIQDRITSCFDDLTTVCETANLKEEDSDRLDSAVEHLQQAIDVLAEALPEVA